MPGIHLTSSQFDYESTPCVITSNIDVCYNKSISAARAELTPHPACFSLGTKGDGQGS